QHGKKHETFFTQVERHALMRSAFIPRLTLVFLARYRGVHDVTSREMPLPFEIEAPHLDGLVQIKGHTVTLTIKQLAIQLLTFRFPPTFRPEALEIRTSFRDDIVVQAWPITGTITWPPPRHLDDSNLDAF